MVKFEKRPWLCSLFGIDDLIGGGIAAGAQVVSTNATNAANLQIARETSAMNQQNAREQMAFQERMSNSAYQRSTADMRAAGINPMLAYMNGGASSPSGAAGTAVSAQMENGVGKGVNSALDYTRMKRELEATNSQVELNKAAKDSQAADAVLKANNARTAVANAKIAEAKVPVAQAEAKVDAQRAKFDEGLVKYDGIANRAARESGTVTNALGGWIKSVKNGLFGESAALRVAGERGIRVK